MSFLSLSHLLIIHRIFYLILSLINISTARTKGTTIHLLATKAGTPQTC